MNWMMMSKKMIYEIEQAFCDSADELNLRDIIIEKKEAYLDWTGLDEEIEPVKEAYGCDEIEAERIADYECKDAARVS